MVSCTPLSDSRGLMILTVRESTPTVPCAPLGHRSREKGFPEAMSILSKSKHVNVANKSFLIEAISAANQLAKTSAQSTRTTQSVMSEAKSPSVRYLADKCERLQPKESTSRSREIGIMQQEGQKRGTTRESILNSATSKPTMKWHKPANPPLYLHQVERECRDKDKRAPSPKREWAWPTCTLRDPESWRTLIGNLVGVRLPIRLLLGILTGTVEGLRGRLWLYISHRAMQSSTGTPRSMRPSRPKLPPSRGKASILHSIRLHTTTN
jgi:hypothetical protein